MVLRAEPQGGHGVQRVCVYVDGYSGLGNGPLCSIDLLLQSLFAADLFFSSPLVCLAQIPEARSTGSKQTLNGLFIFISPTPSTIFVRRPGLIYNFYPLSYRFAPVGPGQSSAILSRRDIIATEVYRWMEKNYWQPVMP